MAASKALGQALADKRIPYNQIPYMVDTTNGPRGTQQGYNLCNSTTEGPSSLCQTSYLNSLDDFCIWGPIKPDSQIADTEGELVAWCTKPGRGTRVIPSGALTGVQFIQTPGYVQVTGRINQTLINIMHGDSGGEEDPHGADGRGNPLGSLVYTNAFPSNNGNNNSFQQVIEWHNFLGGDQFCFKACDPTGPNAARLCEHVFDRIGCAYNAPAAYQDGVFLKCKGDNQDPPGVFTGADGVVSTYTQPPEAAGVIGTLPYQPKVPATSDCVTYQSAQLYAAAASVAPNPNQPNTTSAASPSGTAASAGGSGAATRSGASGSNGSAAPSPTSGAQKNVAGAMAGLLAAVAGLAVLA